MKTNRTPAVAVISPLKTDIAVVFARRPSNLSPAVQAQRAANLDQ